MRLTLGRLGGLSALNLIKNEMEKLKIQVGGRYKTKGGWNAFIYTKINGNPQGWCKDSFGNEEPSMGTWDENTGKCLKRGDSTHIMNTEPYDIISLERIN